MNQPAQDRHTFLRQQRLRQLTSADIGYWTYKKDLLPPEGPYNVNVKKGQNSINLMKKIRREKWDNNGIIPPPSKIPYGGQTGVSIHSTSYKDPNTISGRRHSTRSTSGRTNKRRSSTNNSTINGKMDHKDYLGERISLMKKLRKTSSPELPQTVLHPFVASQNVKAQENWQRRNKPQNGVQDLHSWQVKSESIQCDDNVWLTIPDRKSSRKYNNQLFRANPNQGLYETQQIRKSIPTNSKSKKLSSFASTLKEKYTPPEITHHLPSAQPNALNPTTGEEKVQYEPSLGTIGLIEIKDYPQTEAKCEAMLQEYKLSGNNVLQDIDIQEDDKSLELHNNNNNSDYNEGGKEAEPDLNQEIHISTLKAYKSYKGLKSNTKKKLDVLKARSLAKLGKCLKIPKYYGEYDDYQNGSTFKSARYDRLVTEESKPGTYGFDNNPHDWAHTIADTANGDLRSKDWSHNLRGMRW